MFSVPFPQLQELLGVPAEAFPLVLSDLRDLSERSGGAAALAATDARSREAATPTVRPLFSCDEP